MPFEFDAEEHIEIRPKKARSTGFSVDQRRGEIHHAYVLQDAAGNDLTEGVDTYSDMDFALAVNDSDEYVRDKVIAELAGQGVLLTDDQVAAVRASISVYAGVKHGLYARYQAKSNKIGSIT